LRYKFFKKHLETERRTKENTKIAIIYTIVYHCIITIGIARIFVRTMAGWSRKE